MLLMTDSIESVAPSRTSTMASSALLNRKLGTPENDDPEEEEELRPPALKVVFPSSSSNRIKWIKKGLDKELVYH